MRRTLYRLGRWLLSFEYVAADLGTIAEHDARREASELREEVSRLKRKLAVARTRSRLC